MHLLKELDKEARWPNPGQQDGVGHMLFLGLEKTCFHGLIVKETSIIQQINGL